VIIAVGGSKDMTIPDLDQAVAEFDAFLLEAPPVVDVDEMELLRALKIRR